ncbi:MAG: hypothetical protein V4564_05595 [Pseudomonadota bacterium]|uniref:hypothetical protein n=1 Tax=Sphingomonas sp. ERG5 TaxID=1381597 RepID=UPI00054B8179|nr:hypothetical protein [Sphingomonas sp. ERG5]
MIMLLIWTIAALVAGIYCIARSVVDLRQRKYAWGALGLISAAVFLLAPVPSHEVSVTLPIATSR